MVSPSKSDKAVANAGIPRVVGPEHDVSVDVPRTHVRLACRGVGNDAAGAYVLKVIVANDDILRGERKGLGVIARSLIAGAIPEKCNCIR